jgi:hypothetical protein
MAEYKFDSLITKLDEIHKRAAAISKNMETLHSNVSKLSGTGSFAELSNVTKKLDTETANLVKTEKDYANVIGQVNKLNEKAIKEADKITASLNLELKTKQELAKLQQKEISQQARQNALIEKYSNLEAKSINDLRKKQAALTALRNTLDTTSDKYKKITGELANVNNKLIENGRAVRDTRQEVGGYTFSLKEGLASLKNFALGFVGLAAAIGAIRGLISAAKEYIELAKKSIEQEQKLTVILKQKTGATNDQVQSVIDLANATQEMGVVDGDVLVAGAQQLSISVKRVDTIKQLLPVMGNLLAQQKGVNATEEDGVTIAKALGKAMNGSDMALKKMGITLSESESKMLKYGNESERAALLTKIISSRVGEMNTELGKTDIGKMTILNNQIENMKEDIGKDLIPIMVSFKSISLSAFKELKNVIGELTEPIKLINELRNAFSSTNEEMSKSPTIWDKIGQNIKKAISPLRAIIAYNSILIKGYREALRFLGILESEEAERAGKVRERVDELTKSFNNLSTEQKKGVLVDFNKLKTQFKNGEITAVEFANALNLLIQEAQTNTFSELDEDMTNLSTSTESAKRSVDDLTESLGSYAKKVGEIEKMTAFEGGKISIVPSEATINAEFKTATELIGKKVPRFKAYINKVFNSEAGGTMLSRIFGGGENGQALAETTLQAYGQIMQAMSQMTENQISQLDSIIDKQQEVIDGIKEQIDTENERIEKAIESGQAYDLSYKQSLEKNLALEKQALAKSESEQKRQKEKLKRQAIVQGNINIASAILQIWAQSGTEWYIKLIQSAITAAAGAIQLNAIRTANYAEGTESVIGDGYPDGVDTVPARLTKKERVMTVRQNMELNGASNEEVVKAYKWYQRRNELSKVYVNDNGEVVKKLDVIANNTAQTKGYKPDGSLAWEIRGNNKIFYN